MTTPTFCSVCSGWGELEATDIFCGAGGSSLGLESVCCPLCGRQLIRVTQALNHWDLAVEAHNANFPDADHDVHDVEIIPASRFRRTPLLWASPECTHHAYCRGPRDYDPDALRSRATFDDIVRFTEFHRYDAIIIENVIEARLWCEAATRKHGRYYDKKEKRWSYRCSCAVDFDEWHEAMLALGYQSRIVYFNSQFALPTPQSRDRMYVVFWRNGLPAPNLDFCPESWCPACAKVVNGIQTWKAASKGSTRDRVVFEWGRYGTQYIYTCPNCAGPVAPAVTGARAIVDFSLPAVTIGDREKPLAPKTRERIRAGLERLGSVQPIAVQVGGHMFERRPGVRVWSLDDPMRTVVTASTMAVALPPGTKEPDGFVVRYGGQGASPRVLGEPTQTLTAHDREVGLVIPNREHNVGSVLDEPTRAVTTAPAAQMLVQVNRSTKGKAVDRNADSLDVPTRTIAGHGELALVTLRRNANEAQPIGLPTPTVTGGGNHHGIVVYNGNPGHIRGLDEGIGVVKSRDSQAFVRTPVDPTVIDESQIDACSFRMLQWHELLRAQAPHDHVDGRPYSLTAQRRDKRTGLMKDLSNEERVKMIGNMVSSPVATLLGQALVESLARTA